MSTSSSEPQSTPANPYKAPVSAASPFAKSYLTLAACSGLVVIAILTGMWVYARSASPGIMDRGEGVTVRPYVIQQDAYSNYAKGTTPQPRSRVNDFLSKETSSNQAEPTTTP